MECTNCYCEPNSILYTSTRLAKKLEAIYIRLVFVKISYLNWNLVVSGIELLQAVLLLQKKEKKIGKKCRNVSIELKWGNIFPTAQLKSTQFLTVLPWHNASKVFIKQHFLLLEVKI